MSEPDRRIDRQGAEPPLTIDRDRRRSRRRGPAPVTLIVSVLLLVIVAVGVLYMYRSGARSGNEAPQPVGAPLGDVRQPAPPQTQAHDASDGLTISRDDANAPPAAQTLAPRPEQPLPEPAPEAPTSPAAVAPPPPPPPPSGDVTAHAPAVRHAPPMVDEKQDAIGGLISKVEKNKPAKSDDAPVLIQIGAFTSQNLADKEWSKAAAVAPGAMAGKGKRVVPLTKDGETLYRTSITGFASREQAQALCDRLKAAGGSCFVH